ncbi:MAG: hypothetical protein JNL61_13400, partial [Rhizobiaceae bacterium]|nr:hypothetical protein [Rhizobiaceae bacterium]
MKQDFDQHEKIRFRRDEIVDLGSLPSACEQAGPPVRLGRGRRRGLPRMAKAATALVVLVALIIGGAVFSSSLFDIGADRMRAEAEKAMRRVTGVDVVASHGSTGLSFDRSSLLAVEIADVDFTRASDNAPLLKAGTVRFELRMLPLLQGRVELGGATIADARIAPDAFPVRTDRDWAASLRDERGLIDPDRVLATVFAGVGKALDGFAGRATNAVELRNIRIDLPAAASGQTITLARAALTVPEPGRMALAAEAEISGRRIMLAGDALRDPASGRVSALNVGITGARPETMVADNGSAPLPAAAANEIGAFSLTLAGGEGAEGQASHIDLDATIDSVAVDFGRFGVWRGTFAADTTLANGAGKLEIERLRIISDRTSLDFNGAVGPVPVGQDGSPAYRFELVSQNSVLAPTESPEPPLGVGARVSGRYDPQARRLTADQIELSGGAGQALGTLSVDFAPGKAPGISLALSAAGMPVAHVKQLWPWFSAPPARRWVLNNVFGGTVTDSRLVMNVAPGHLGNGVPLTGDEVSGSVTIDDTRFDLTGQIPPVRDAFGKVEFRGADVDIGLNSGTIFLPSGHTVAGTDGRLLIRNANQRPVIGDLDIDVSGEAAAVAELAAYEPMNALQNIGLTPSDFAGIVKGHVKADIPLHRGIPRDILDWRVSLAYDNLSLARKFDGQLLTDADGTLVVDKTRAIVEAEGKLNGATAELSLTEPIGQSEVQRKRQITMTLDDQARRKIAPGLNDLLSGPVKLDVDILDDGRREVSADLTKAELTLPWANWSKGAGIPAKMTFRMDERDGGIVLSNVDLSGATFGAKGTIRLAGGSLDSADLTGVKLNRGDDASVRIKRSGRGYAIAIGGSSVDARALIKQYVASGGSGGDAAAGSGSKVPVTLEMRVGSLGGFGGEKLSDVSFNYSSSGSAPGTFSFKATTDGGGAVSAVNAVDGGSRKLTVKSADAGALVRFLDIYPHMQGGQMSMALTGGSDGVLRGQVEARNFYIVDEPRIRSLVSTPPPGTDRSLNDAVRGDVDVSRAQFERGFAQIEKGEGYLRIANGVLRGPLIGSTFQGTLYDAKGRMDMTGTFMPAYGLNRIFGELPLIGNILGNGRDRGLIGVTYRLAGKA